MGCRGGLLDDPDDDLDRLVCCPGGMDDHAIFTGFFFELRQDFIKVGNHICLYRMCPLASLFVIRHGGERTQPPGGASLGVIIQRDLEVRVGNGFTDAGAEFIAHLNASLPARISAM